MLHNAEQLDKLLNKLATTRPTASALKRRGNLYKDDDGDWIIGFGQYAKDGGTVKLKDLASLNPLYLRWLPDNTKFLTIEQLDLIKEALETASAN